MNTNNLPPLVDATASLTSPPESYALPSETVLKSLGVVPESGLTTAEVNARQLKFGLNALQQVKNRSAWRIFADQFASIVVALLAFAALISFITRDYLEGFAILVVLLINAFVGFLTEFQAGRALDALRRQTRTITRVRRDGFELAVDAEQIVPGDILILSSGDHVPADARILEAVGLQTQESALTGESTLVEKNSSPVETRTPIAERRSMLYLGTAVATGHATAVVVGTGSATELGRVGRLVSVSTKERSPLELQLIQLGRRLVYLVLGIAAVVILTGWVRGDGLWLMTEVGISLAVAAVPEGLPAITTLILALGVLRMARHHAIMRRLTAVQTLGSTTVICSDKTGTLTENRMSVREYYLSDGRVIEIADEDKPSENDGLFEEAVRVGILCNEASFHDQATDDTRTLGDPTETALLVVADELVLDVSEERAKHPKVAELPFDSSTKRMTTLHRRNDGLLLAALKGAPSVVLNACSSFVDSSSKTASMDSEARARFRLANEQMTNRSLRVLALAVKRFVLPLNDGVSEDELKSGFTFLGLVGLSDPPRAGVANAIRVARTAGIRTVMLTGDQLNTGRAIARELGLGGGHPVAIHARDLIEADHARLAELAHRADVFARVSPEDKLRIVEALQRSGEIVAVTGDGVNDAPALKRANIGIAMGKRGTEVAKEAADVVLADDNFESIVEAIEGGRTIYANIIKFVHMMFSHNLAEVTVIFTAIVGGWPLPLLPLQILWMNLITDVFPALALAVEPPSDETMQRPPHSADTSLLSRPFLILIGWQSLMLSVLSLGAYQWALARYGASAHSRTIALFTLIGVQLTHTFNCRSRTRSAFEGLFRNWFLWIAMFIVILLQVFALYFAPLASVLGTVKLSMWDGLVVCGCALATIPVVEITKLFHRRSFRPSA